MLVEHGYGVLLFDRRGEGASEGDGNLFGWDGERDIYAALDYLEQRPDVDPGRIGGIGLSVGGELMLQAAAEDDRLAAVVSEGAGTRSLAEELEEYDGMPSSRSALPLHRRQDRRRRWPSPTRRRRPSSPTWSPQIAPRPALLHLGAEAERRRADEPDVPPAGRPELRRSGSSRTRKHVRGLAHASRSEYEQRVVGFFDATLLGGRTSGLPWARVASGG